MTNLADGVAVVASGWVASLLTRDALLVALVPVALRLPWFLFALPAGVVTDRVDRRRLISAMDGLRAAAFVLAAVAIWAALSLAVAPMRGVPDAGLYAMILIAGLVVGGAALTLALTTAALGAGILTLAAWRPLSRGFAGNPDKKI